MMSARTATREIKDFFFHDPSFVYRNNPQNVVEIKIGSEPETASIYFSKTKNSINSLQSSPFGGLILHEASSRETALQLVQSVDVWCRTNQVNEVSIRQFPRVYDPLQAEMIHGVLLEAGYSVVAHELLHFIQVEKNSAELFNRNRKRKLKACIDAGYTFSQLNIGHLEEAYEIFVECRTDKNYPVTMRLEDFKKAFEKFPDRYFLFGVKDNATLVAASVCIAVNSDIFYDFFHGDKINAREFSPLSLLVKGLLEFCIDRKFRLLDLGVSSDSNGINKGLEQFKLSFGAQRDEKLTYYKQIKPA